MKKTTLFAMLMIVSLTLAPSATFATEKNPTAIANNTKEVPAAVKVMLNRLEEIKEMDKSSLTSSEKKVLRKEVKTIKNNLKASGNGGVYLSVGAIIIIILLLILLL